MDIIIPALVLSAFGYHVWGDSDEPAKVQAPANIVAESKRAEIDSDAYDQYIRRNAEEPIIFTPKTKEPYANTTIVNNPGFKPIVDNLYFFKNYYQLNIKQYKIENKTAKSGANINLTIDSPKMINFQDGYQFDYKDSKYFDGIIIRAQLLPISDEERKFRLIYEIESTNSSVKKNDFAAQSSSNVMSELVNKDIEEKAKYQVIKNGYNVYTERVYSIDEKIIDVSKPTFIDVGPYRLELNLSTAKKSDLYYNAQNINCKNKVCEVMRKNTINKQK
jgi:hypothetical protein